MAAPPTRKILLMCKLLPLVVGVFAKDRTPGAPDAVVRDGLGAVFFLVARRRQCWLILSPRVDASP